MNKPSFTLVVGLGKTGLSCLRYLAKKNIPIAVTDSRAEPPELKIVQTEFPNVLIECGKFSESLIQQATELVMSPGVSLQEPAIAKRIAEGVLPIGDIELFVRDTKVPIIGITGSNGKSTVTTLMGEMAKAAKISAGVGGNLGTPVLDLLEEKNVKLFVLELSSFQLETTYSLQAQAAVVLNVSPDHLDRHGTYENYIRAKQRIYDHCKQPIINLDDELSWRAVKFSKKPWGFSSLENPPKAFAKKIFHLMHKNNETYLACDHDPFMKAADCYLHAPHDLQNALAAIALGTAAHFPLEIMCETLKNFKGLKHRCTLVQKKNDVSWYDDSKGTNVGASVAAMKSLSQFHPNHGLILIAGGEFKEKNCDALVATANDTAKVVILMGRDAQLIADGFKHTKMSIYFVNSMEEAVGQAQKLAASGDGVLLSPACASFDMFKNYEHRGDEFARCVHELK